MMQANGSRVFMVVDPDPGSRQLILDTLKAAYSGAALYEASDGRSALYKMMNVPPQVLVIAAVESGAELSCSQVIASVLREQATAATKIIVLSDLPSQESLLDEVATGKVQFTSRPIQENLFLKAVNRALNLGNASAASSYKLKLLAPGESLFKQGDPANITYLVKAGRLQATRHQDGKSMVLGQINAGEFVGEMAYINGEPRSADVEALENCELIEIPKDTFDTLLFSKPSWSMALMKTLSKRLKNAQ